jgi:hypothetical protein
MPNPSQVLRGARGHAGLTEAQVAASANLPISWYRDLEEVAGEIENNVSIEKLLTICSLMRIEPSSLFLEPSVGRTEPITLQGLLLRIKERIKQENLSVDDFEERIGYHIADSLGNPTHALAWNLDCLKQACVSVGVHWVDLLNSMARECRRQHE